MGGGGDGGVEVGGKGCVEVGGRGGDRGIVICGWGVNVCVCVCGYSLFALVN